MRERSAYIGVEIFLQFAEPQKNFKQMKYSAIVSFLFLLVMGMPALAQEGPTFKVQVSSDSVLLGNIFIVKFILENAQGEQFEAPEFSEFEIVAGPSYSSNMSIVNGEMNQSVSYIYYLKPRDIGNFFIHPASIATKESVLETDPLEIMVVPNPDGIIKEPKSESDRFDFRFEELMTLITPLVSNSVN